MSEFSWAEFAATAVISVISYWIGARTARYTFDLSKDAEERRAASGLRADLDRIRESLGDRAETFGAVVSGLTFETPRLHRWSESFVAQLAAADPFIVRHAMELERELHNFSTVSGLFHEARTAGAAAQDRAKEVKEHPYPETFGENFHEEWAVRRVNAEAEVERLRDAQREAIRLMNNHHGAALAHVAALTTRLDLVIDRKSPAFLELREERTRAITARTVASR